MVAITSSAKSSDALDDGHELLAEAAQAVDGVLPRDAVGDEREQQHQRQVAPSRVRSRACPW